MNFTRTYDFSSENSAFKPFSAPIQSLPKPFANSNLSEIQSVSPPTKPSHTPNNIVKHDLQDIKMPSHNDKKIGRWDKEEHLRFLDAVERYGNSWELVKEHIQTRTCTQIRSHAQKYYEGLKNKAILKAKKANGRKQIFVVIREYLNTSMYMKSSLIKKKKL